MKYRFSYQNPLQHVLLIELAIANIDQDQVTLHLPSWRPGRYEIANFAQNVINLEALNSQQNPLPVSKVSKDTWIVRTKGCDQITVAYNYYAFAMDAGNSWLDEDQLYINFINCCLFTEDRLNEACEVELVVPEDYQCATGLRRLNDHKFKADSYYQLVDSPLIASNSLRRIQYRVDEKEFNIWILGNLPRKNVEVIEDFKAFTKKQIEVMGTFPCNDYHFLFQCLPYRHYHGVEHFNSTTITIGPSEELAERPQYKKLLGVSCHELFHTWNVIRLRPKEMVPYNFKSENYHKTGFVTEGVTTYYGDLFLVRSGVWSLAEYLEELNVILKKHYENGGRNNMSVADSSFDLWLDGYKIGVPDRKVSIYNEGALAALILDLTIRHKWNHKKSLDDVMRLMWERHGSDFSGYSPEDYRNCAEHVFGEPLEAYFSNFIEGVHPFESEMASLFEEVGLDFRLTASEKPNERKFGFRLSDNTVTGISKASPAEKVLSLQDKLLKVNDIEFAEAMEFGDSVELEIDRFSKIITVELNADGSDHFSIFQVAPSDEVISKNLARWLEQ